mgnify:CR=1 FL=1
MAEYVAGKGTTALGIIGTVLGSIGTAGSGLNLLGARPAAVYENNAVCVHDMQMTQELAKKDAEISRLQGEQYTNNAVIDLYKYIDGELKGMREQSNGKWTEQAVVNANLSNGLTALSGQVANTAQLVAQITKTAVPSSAICNFNSGCGSCGGSVNI